MTRPGQGARLPELWMWLATAAALLAAVGSVIGVLAGGAIYGQETDSLADAAAAQDVVNLILVAPLTAILGHRARHGGLKAYVVWLGLLVFTVYNYAIFAFSVQFGPLFPVWVTVLGLSIYALAGGLVSLNTAAVAGRFGHRPMAPAGWALIACASFFTFLWLSEILPDLFNGAPSSSASQWRIPTNPVHVLDLALLLPAVFASGTLLLRREPLGYSTAPGQLAFLGLTCLPILLTPFIAQARGHDPGWAVVPPVGILLLGLVGFSGGPCTACAQATPSPDRMADDSTALLMAHLRYSWAGPNQRRARTAP